MHSHDHIRQRMSSKLEERLRNVYALHAPSPSNWQRPIRELVTARSRTHCFAVSVSAVAKSVKRTCKDLKLLVRTTKRIVSSDNVTAEVCMKSKISVRPAYAYPIRMVSDTFLERSVGAVHLKVFAASQRMASFRCPPGCLLASWTVRSGYWFWRALDPVQCQAARSPRRIFEVDMVRNALHQQCKEGSLPG